MKTGIPCRIPMVRSTDFPAEFWWSVRVSTNGPGGGIGGGQSCEVLLLCMGMYVDFEVEIFKLFRVAGRGEPGGVRRGGRRRWEQKRQQRETESGLD